MSTTDVELENRRRGFWLREARSRRGLSQEGVAELVGLSAKSKSTISDWEKGTSAPKLHQLKALARLYGVPVSWFLDPPPTAEERLDAVAAGAGALEREDWEREQGVGPRAAGGPAV